MNLCVCVFGMELGTPSSWIPDIHIKRDPRQLTFTIPQHLLPTARCVLFHRYINNISSHHQFTVSWKDESSKPIRPIFISDIYNDLNNITNALPPELFQSKIVVSAETLKIVTVTIYYTQGTVLVQGTHCPSWRDKEFDALVACIRTLYALRDTDQLHATRDETLARLSLPPVPGSRPTLDTARRLSRRLRALSPVPEDTGLEIALATDTHSSNSIPISDLPISTQTSSPSTLCQTSLHHHTIHLGPSTSPLNLTTDLQPPISTNAIQEATTSSTPSPLGLDADTQPSATLDPSPPQPFSNDAVPDPSNCSVGTVQTTDCQSDDEWMDVHQVRDSRMCYIIRRRKPVSRPLTFTKTKMALKLLQRCFINVRETARQKYCQLVSDIEAAKAQVKSEVKTHIKVNLREQADALTSLASAVKKLELQNNQLKTQVGDLKKQLTTAKCICCGSTKASSPSTTPLSHTSSSNYSPLPPSTTSTPSAMVTATQSSVEQPVHTVMSDPQTPPTSLSPPPTPNSSARERQKQATPVTVESTAADLASTDYYNSSLRQSLMQHQIDTRSTHVLIGDSVAKSIISTQIIGTQSLQAICVPGLQIPDLNEWLRHVPCSQHVQQVTVHAGIDTCMYDAITVSMWSQLLRLLNKAFPNARLAISSIIPPLIRYNSLYKTVSVSNLHLKEACLKGKCAFVDNTSLFCTIRGLPKKAMYNDSVHPSRRGAVGIADNIKSALQPPAHPHVLSTAQYTRTAPLAHPLVSSTAQSTSSAPLTHPFSGTSFSTRRHSFTHHRASSMTPASWRTVAAPLPATQPSWASHLFGQRAMGQVPGSIATERNHYKQHKSPLLPTPTARPLTPEYNLASPHRSADSHRPYPVAAQRSNLCQSTNNDSRSNVKLPPQYLTPGHAHSNILYALGQPDQFYSLMHKIMQSVLTSF